MGFYSENDMHGQELVPLGQDTVQKLTSQSQLRKDLFTEVSAGIRKYIYSSVEGLQPESLYWLKTADVNELDLDLQDYTGLANLHRINDIARINKFLERANTLLSIGSYHIICLETKDQRKARLLNKYPKIFNHIIYSIDFVLNRVFPKWGPTKKLYFAITKGRNRVISLTEAIGRLASCGFETVEYRRIGYLTYVISRKVREPVYDMKPTYGLLIKLKRVGYQGKKIHIYKFRTMHPYSEYMQEYLYNRNGTINGDKILDDFRVTRWGRFFRSLWIDELPMLYNFIKGDLKLVGVRPLSEHKFSTYPESLQNERIKVKPGLIPPFYADLPDSPEEFHASEENYLRAYAHSPKRTDIRYFFKALNNILIKGARSK